MPSHFISKTLVCLSNCGVRDSCNLQTWEEAQKHQPRGKTSKTLPLPKTSRRPSLSRPARSASSFPPSAGRDRRVEAGRLHRLPERSFATLVLYKAASPDEHWNLQTAWRTKHARCECVQQVNRCTQPRITTLHRGTD